MIRLLLFIPLINTCQAFHLPFQQTFLVRQNLLPVKQYPQSRKIRRNNAATPDAKNENEIQTASTTTTTTTTTEDKKKKEKKKKRRDKSTKNVVLDRTKQTSFNEKKKMRKKNDESSSSSRETKKKRYNTITPKPSSSSSSSSSYSGKNYLQHKFESKLLDMQEKDRKGIKLTQAYCDNTLGLAVSSNAWEDVLTILQIMTNQNLSQQRSTYRACLQSCFEVGNYESALEILNAMTHALIYPTFYEIQLVVFTICKQNKYRKGIWRQGLKLLKSYAEEGMEVKEVKDGDGILAVEAYDAVIFCMGKEGQWKEAMKLLDLMWQGMDKKKEEEGGLKKSFHPKPKLSTYHAVLEAFLNCEQAEQAMTLLRSMPSKGTMPIAHTYNLVISTLLRKRQWRRAISILDLMDQRNIPATTITYNSIITACAKAREADSALNLLSQMKRRGIHLDIFTYNSAISACANTNRWKDALNLLNQCRNEEPNVKPDIITYTTAIRACSRARKTKRALSLLEVARDEGLKLDVYAYTNVIDACAKGRMWRKALDLLDEMRQEGLQPNSVTYSVAIVACGNGGQWERALELLYQMREKNMEINVITYNAAISALAKASRQTTPKFQPNDDDNDQQPPKVYKIALSLLSQMQKDGVEPDAYSYSSAISACGSGGKWKEALELIKIMQRGGPKLRPNTIAYTAAINACGKSGEWEHAMTLFEDMKTSGVMPDRVAYNALVGALKIAKQEDKIYEIWNEMCGQTQTIDRKFTATPDSKSITPDIITVTDVLLTLNNDDKKSDIVFAEAVKRGIVLQSRLDSSYEVDLSGMAFPVARCAVRFVLNNFLNNDDKKKKKEDSVVIRDLSLITGMGRRKEEGGGGGGGGMMPQQLGLREYVREILREDIHPPIYSTVPKNAQGTVVVKKEKLEKWIDSNKDKK